MDFAQPGLLGNHGTFVKRFSDPIDQGSLRGANPFQAELKRCLAQQLRLLIRPHMLRRTKVGTGLVGDADEIEVRDRLSEMEDIFGEKETQDKEGENTDTQVQKLPPKLETIVWLMPSAEQLSAYQKVLAKSDIIKEAAQKNEVGP
jgi:SNF2 family DNA or RNA helicase